MAVSDLPDLCIGIVTWNSSGVISECLGALHADNQRTKRYQVVVVDNASSDTTTSIIGRLFPDARLVVNQSNRGFATAMMQAFRNAPARYYLMLNPDTVVSPDVLYRMIEYMDKHRGVGIASCKLQNVDGSVQHSVRHFPTLRNQLFDAIGLARLFPKHEILGGFYWSWFDYNEEQEVEQVSGALAIIRAETMEMLGGLDESFFVYFEDIDLCYRARQQDWKVMYVPQYTALHVGGDSSRQVIDKRVIYRYESMYRYFLKHHPGDASRLKWVILLFSITRLVATLLAKPSQLADYWRGYSWIWQNLVFSSGHLEPGDTDSTKHEIEKQ